MTVMQSIEDSWAEIVTLTKAIYSAANQNDWPHVLLLTSQRQQTLENHFSLHPIGPGNADFYREQLNSLLHGENELQALVRESRKALMREGLAIQTGNRAAGAYLNAAINR